MTKISIDTSSLEAKNKKKGLDPVDQAAAERAYALYLKKHKASMEVVREFIEKNPGADIPDGMKVTQSSVADSVGWTQGNLSQYLTGAVPIREKALQTLCLALDCDPWDIRPESLFDTKLIKKNQKLVMRVNSSEKRSEELESELHSILSNLKEIEGLNPTVDKIIKKHSLKLKAA